MFMDGVPIIALEGERMIERQTSAILRLLGLDAWVAGSLDDYLALAIRLSSETQKIQELRQTLRARMMGTALIDAKQFTAQLEQAYRSMWRNFCVQQKLQESI